MSLPWCIIEHMFERDTDTELAIASSPDLIDAIRAEEREISRRRASQMRLLRELLRRSFPGPQPSAGMISSELDVSNETARASLETASRTPEESDRMVELEAGRWSG